MKDSGLAHMREIRLSVSAPATMMALLGTTVELQNGGVVANYMMSLPRLHHLSIPMSIVLRDRRSAKPPRFNTIMGYPFQLFQLR